MPSSVISRFNYNPSTGILRITYLSGAIYDYKEVPETVMAEFKKARSKGIFLNTMIKGVYDFEKVA